VTGISYNARGQRTQVQYANGVTTNFTYFDQAADPKSFRPKARVTTGPGGTLQSFTYAHDNVGNITQITDAAFTGGRTFEYDALNRLTQASGTFGTNQANVNETYAYDAVGNVTSKAGIAYAYSDPLHPSAVTSRSDGPTYTYDANGNMLTGAGRTLAWDYDNRLAAVTIQGGNSAEFAYDHAGQRVRKTVNAGSVTRYPFPGYEIGPDGVILARFGEIARKSSGQTLTYHNDHLGGVHVITDQTGVRVQLVEYTPWGEMSRSEGTADLDRRFTGQRRDPETGLMYYGGRYYDPALARFVSADPFVPSPGNPQNFNRYSYVENNPVNFTDPTGFKKKSFWKKLLRLHLSVDRYVGPVVAGIIVGVFTPQPFGAVAGAAVAGGLSGALNTLYYGGSAEDVALNSAIGGGIGAVAAVVGGAAGYGVGLVAGEFAGVVAGAAAGGATAGALSAAIYGGDVGQAALYGAAISAVAAAAAYGGYRAYDYIKEQWNVGEAIRLSESSDWATTAEGSPTIDRLQTMHERGQISFRKMRQDWGGYWDPATDEIFLSIDLPKIRLPGVLVHEGYHATFHRFTERALWAERAAFDAQYAVESQLGVLGREKVTDWMIRFRYCVPGYGYKGC
jgi:RHS repeat-associated protein